MISWMIQTDLISTIIRTAPITPVPALVHTPLVDVPTPPTPPTPPPPPTPQSVPQIVTLKQAPLPIMIHKPRYKARLVANWLSTQVEGVDVDETFSPVVKPGTIRTVLSLAISQHWPVHQLDVKNAFLHVRLFEVPLVYGLVALGCALLGLLYYVGHLLSVVCDSSLFIYKQGDDTAFLLLYVDDIVLTTASSDRLLQQIIASLHRGDFERLSYGSGCEISSLDSVDTESKVRGVGSFGLWFDKLFSSTTDSLIAYSDADWAGCPTTRRSTLGSKVRVFSNRTVTFIENVNLPIVSSLDHHMRQRQAHVTGIANIIPANDHVTSSEQETIMIYYPFMYMNDIGVTNLKPLIMVLRLLKSAILNGGSIAIFGISGPLDFFMDAIVAGFERVWVLHSYGYLDWKDGENREVGVLGVVELEVRWLEILVGNLSCF
ncbi:ribonuclease H-like domain-containing protein [Tanacetum coccineum]